MIYILALSIIIFIIASLKFLKFPIKAAFKNTIISPSVLTWIFIFIYCILSVQIFWIDDFWYLEKNYEHTLHKTYEVLSLFFLIFFLTELIAYPLIKIEKTKNILLTNHVNFFNFVNIYTLLVLTTFIIFLPNSNQIGILNFFFNTLIPIIGFYVINKNKKFYIYFFIYILLSVFIGFRFRLAVLFIPIIIFIFMRNKILSTKFFSLVIFSFLFLTLLVLVGNFRQYNDGLNFELFTFENFFSLYSYSNGIFNDTSTVLVTGAFIEEFDQIGKYAYFSQIKYVIEFFVPSFLLEKKSYSPILSYVYSVVGTDIGGSAVMGFGEYYHTAGFYGVAIFALFYSLYFTYSYKKFIQTNINFYLFSYLSFVTWFINSLTRGYLPQNIFDLVALCFGLYIVKYQYFKK